MCRTKIINPQLQLLNYKTTAIPHFLADYPLETLWFSVTEDLADGFAKHLQQTRVLYTFFIKHIRCTLASGSVGAVISRIVS